MLIKKGDQIKLIGEGGTSGEEDTLDQVTPYYLVVEKFVGGRDIQLDRVPSDSTNNPLTGEAGVFKSTLRIFSHRILEVPIQKTADVELLIRWRIIFS